MHSGADVGAVAASSASVKESSHKLNTVYKLTNQNHKQYPTEILPSPKSTEVPIFPDSHGSALLIIQRLIHRGIMAVTASTFEALANLVDTFYMCKNKAKEMVSCITSHIKGKELANTAGLLAEDRAKKFEEFRNQLDIQVKNIQQEQKQTARNAAILAAMNQGRGVGSQSAQTPPAATLTIRLK